MRKIIPLIMALLMMGLTVRANELRVNTADSSVAVDVKASPPHSFTCDLEHYEAHIDIEPVTGMPKEATFVFNLTDLETHNEKRNRKMHGWMDTEVYNRIEWKMDSLETAEGVSVGHGQLKMHGASYPVDVPFTLSKDGEQVVLEGEAEFDYMNFGLPKIRLFLFTVKPALHVHFQLRGILAPE